MRNVRLIVAIALAFGGAISMGAAEVEAGKPGRRGGARGKTSIRINPGRINTVQGAGPRHTVRGPVRFTGDRGPYGGYIGGFGGYGGLGGYGYGNGFGNFFELPYATGRIPTPPYFSIHPPVYYTHPVGRTYGYSPFAYPGTVRTPEVVALPEPQTMVNPYVEQTKVADKEEDGEPTPATQDDFAKAEPQPETIINPYVDHPSQFPPAFDMEITVAED